MTIRELLLSVADLVKVRYTIVDGRLRMLCGTTDPEALADVRVKTMGCDALAADIRGLAYDGTALSQVLVGHLSRLIYVYAGGSVECYVDTSGAEWRDELSMLDDLIRAARNLIRAARNLI